MTWQIWTRFCFGYVLTVSVQTLCIRSLSVKTSLHEPNEILPSSVDDDWLPEQELSSAKAQHSLYFLLFNLATYGMFLLNYTRNYTRKRVALVLNWSQNHVKLRLFWTAPISNCKSISNILIEVIMNCMLYKDNFNDLLTFLHAGKKDSDFYALFPCTRLCQNARVIRKHLYCVTSNL